MGQKWVNGYVTFKDMMKELLTVKEAAHILSVHPETLRRWDSLGKIPAGIVQYTQGGHRRFVSSRLNEIKSLAYAENGDWEKLAPTLSEAAVERSHLDIPTDWELIVCPICQRKQIACLGCDNSRFCWKRDLRQEATSPEDLRKWIRQMQVISLLLLFLALAKGAGAPDSAMATIGLVIIVGFAYVGHEFSSMARKDSYAKVIAPARKDVLPSENEWIKKRI